MDLDEALDAVIHGAVVQRPTWGPDDVVVRFYEKGLIAGWRTTRVISCPDMVADDWRVVGRLQ